MGRLLKKKDPVKKKALRDVRVDGNSEAPNAAGGAVTSKATSVIRKPTAPPKPKAVVGEPNFIQKSTQFLREVKIELKKVTWPSRKQTMGSTLVVLVLVMIISLFLGMVDFSLSSLMRMVLP
jgi:preprotein translocase subunit SecE